MRLAACLAALALAGPLLPAAAAAQQPPADTVLTPEQRALERLRSLGAVSQPDTLPVPEDTLRAQQVRLAGGRGELAAPTRIERDSIMDMLLGVRDYVATEYSGDLARFQADSSVLELRGSPQVAREGSQLVADSLIVYDERSARACGYGQPVLHAVGMTNPLVSDTVCFDVVRQVGYAKGAQTTVSEGATWHLRGDVYFRGDDFYSHRARFTDCELTEPHYHFAAGAVKVVRENVLVARDVTLNFADVPVLWLPFMVQSLSEGRRSGILMPRFGINDIARSNARYSRRIEDVGVYWAINDYMGSELALDWFADNWTGVRGSLDYNFAHLFLRGGLTYRRFWKQEGGEDFSIASQNSWQIDERTNVNLAGNYVTSTAFVRERTFDPRELNRSIDSNASLRRRFDWGSMSLGASRSQFLSDNTVRWQLPSLGLNFSPITLFEALPGDESWYSNATWQGDVDLRIQRFDVGEQSLNPRAQGRRDLTSGVNSRLSLGRLSWNQRFNFDDQVRHERMLPDDTLPTLPGSSEQRGRWSTTLNFQQRLIGNSTITPGLALGSEFIRGDRTDDVMVYAPTRVDFNAALRTELYGFWPGVGPFERFRHRVSPSFSYNFSPEARADSLQRAVFSSAGVAEQNRISIGLSQTFEARRRAEDREPAAAEADTAAAEEVVGEPGAPRRREQAAPIQLLSISTDALVYDFVRARDGDGIVTTQISNSIQSDLMRGLQLSFTHDLFRTPPPGEEGVPAPREFAPHLSRVNAAFSLDGNSWLFRLLRLGRAEPEAQPGGGDPLQEGDPLGAGPALDRTESEYGMIGTSRRMGMGAPRGSVGAWNASINYTMFRPRVQQFGEGESQMATGNFSFQPTVNWSVRWSTGYSFTTNDFTDHILTLTRTLHDWDANFDFVRAQNGNFSFQFRVHLRANPDIKLDYSQSDSPAIRDAQGIR
jgi:hypothetical protein